MKEEVKRIIKLVQEGKLTAEDAADLIDAFNESERKENQEAEAAAANAGAGTHGDATPPPPPHGAHKTKDVFASIAETIERIGKEASDSVNWQEVAKQARTSASKGFDALKTGVEQISKGKLDMSWLGMQESREISLPLTVKAGKTLKVENPCGDVKIVGGFNEGSVTAKARFRGGSHEELRHKADTYTLIVEEGDHGVVIRQPDVTGLSVDLEIQIGTRNSVEVRTESGDISVIDTQGGARINARSGEVRLRGLNGVLEVSVTSGDVKVEDTSTPSLSLENKSGDLTLNRIAGNINARTASGDVRLTGSAGKSVSIESVSGDVTVDLETPVTGSLSVRTVNGDALVAVPDGTDARVSISTLRGVAVCRMPLQDEAKAEQRITGRLGEGSGSIDVSAVTGNVTLEMYNSA